MQKINPKPDPTPIIKVRGSTITRHILMIANTANLSMNLKKGLAAASAHLEAYMMIVMSSEALKQITAISNRCARIIRQISLKKLVIL
jgi:hypothetical protein